jgi:hypothetical protein
MQAHSNFVSRVANLVEAKRVRHIRDLIFLVDRVLHDFRADARTRWISVPCLAESAFQKFHQAMRVGMIVYWTAFSRGPNEYELSNYLLVTTTLPTSPVSRNIRPGT